MKELESLDLELLSRVFQSRVSSDSEKGSGGQGLDPESIWRFTDPDEEVDPEELQSAVRQLVASPSCAEDWRIAKAFHENRAALQREGVLDLLSEVVRAEIARLPSEPGKVSVLSEAEQGRFFLVNEDRSERQKPSHQDEGLRTRLKSSSFFYISALACVAVALLIWWGENRGIPGGGSEQFRGEDSTSGSPSADEYSFDGVEFRWPAVPGAKNYELAIVDANSLETLVRVTAVDGTAYRLTERERTEIHGREFHWQVRALSKQGEIKRSAPFFVSRGNSPKNTPVR